MGIFEIYKDDNDKFRWEFRESSGRVIAESAEGFTTKVGCLSTIHLVKIESITGVIVDKIPQEAVVEAAGNR
jgi:uncharacterized protein YegP (UPF0339 family)